MSGLSDDLIRSRDNPIAKRIRSLRQRKSREMERAFVVEGRRAVEDALVAGGDAEIILVRDGASWSPPPTSMVTSVRIVEARLFDELSETVTPQPLIGIFAIPDIGSDPGALPFVLVVDGVRDPGNLGTLLRSAAAVGVNLVLLTPGTVDAFNGKVVRAAMGAHFRVPIHELDDDWSTWLQQTCQVRALADAEGETEYSDYRWEAPLAVIVGSEAEGPTAVGRALATVGVRIPLMNEVESLNAGVAGSVILFEAARQLRAGVQGRTKS